MVRLEVEIRRNPERGEPVLILEVPEVTAETEALAARLRALDSGVLLGWRDGRAHRLDPEAIVRFYAEDKEVYAEDAGRTRYLVRKRLYALEALLDKRGFARISHSEIVNLRQIRAMNLKLSGTIQMTLQGGTVCYASRRYVKKIKEALGI